MRASLRARIFAACLAVGSGTSVLFGGLALLLLEAMEFEQIDLVLDDEIARFAQARARDPAAPAPHTSFIEAWAVPVHDVAALPDEIEALPPGMTELADGARERRVAVRDLDGSRYVVALDLTRMEPWEDHATGAVVLLVVVSALLSGLLGRALANRVADPVTRLAEQVGRSGPDGGAAFAALAGEDEIGRLAAALQRYAERIDAFTAREREFSAFVSHELRTPLAVIGTSLELARETGPAPPAHAALARGVRAAAAMRETLDALMVLGRAEAGAAAALAQDPAAVVREVVADVTAAGAARIVTDLQPCAPVRAVPGALRVVVHNLVDNACVHGAGTQVDVALAGGRLTVRDRGPGVAAAQRGRIFDSFVQGKDAASGSGLGLAIVARMCAHHGWTLSMDSAAGRGTEVCVDFAAAS